MAKKVQQPAKSRKQNPKTLTLAITAISELQFQRWASKKTTTKASKDTETTEAEGVEELSRQEGNEEEREEERSAGEVSIPLTFILAGNYEEFVHYCRSRDLNRPDFVYLNKTAERLLRGRLGCRLIRIGTWRERRDLEYVNELIRIDHFEEVRDEDVLADGAGAK